MDGYFSGQANLAVTNILDSLDVGVFITDADCIVIAMNETFERLTTGGRQELLDRSVQYMLDKGYISHSVCRAVREKLQPVTGILRCMNSRRDVIVTGKPVFGEDGRLQFIVCTLRDWTLHTGIYQEPHAEHLPDAVSENLLVKEAVRLASAMPLRAIVEKVEKAVILNSIEQTGTLQDTARHLGIDLSTLTRKKQRYGIFKRSRVSEQAGL